MPSNIFATTTTSVSILFIDKTKVNENIILMDASSLGKKIKLDEGQRTILSEEEKYKIVSYFKEEKEKVEFSVVVSNDEIKENGYSIQAGQYVELKEEILGFDIDERLNWLKSEINKIRIESNRLDEEIINIMGEYDNV